MRPKVTVVSVIKQETYVDLLLDQVPYMGFKIRYLKIGDPPAKWIFGQVTYSPPEIYVTYEMNYPFDIEQNSQEIADWVKKTLAALNQSIRMIINSGNSHVTFRPVQVQYDPNKVKLSTRVSVCVF